MQVAVGIDGDRLLTQADRDFSRLNILQTNQLSALTGLDIDESDVMRCRHRMRFLADTDLQLVVITLQHDRQVILVLSVSGVRLQLLHLYATAFRHSAAINHLDDDVATHLAMIEFRFHTLFCV